MPWERFVKIFGQIASLSHLSAAGGMRFLRQERGRHGRIPDDFRGCGDDEIRGGDAEEVCIEAADSVSQTPTAADKPAARIRHTAIFIGATPCGIIHPHAMRVIIWWGRVLRFKRSEIELWMKSGATEVVYLPDDGDGKPEAATDDTASTGGEGQA